MNIRFGTYAHILLSDLPPFHGDHMGGEVGAFVTFGIWLSGYEFTLQL